jgi:transposase
MRRCPECGYSRAWQLSDSRLRCRRCRTRYRNTTAWNSIRLSGATKRRLVEFFVLGVPVYRMRFRVKASRPTVERFFRLIRACLALKEQCRESFKGPVECDETTFGGHRRGKRGWGAAGKVIVLGILQRNGKVRVFPVQGRKASEVIRLVRSATRPGSLYYTDNWHAYASFWQCGEIILSYGKRRESPKAGIT